MEKKCKSCGKKFKKPYKLSQNQWLKTKYCKWGCFTQSKDRRRFPKGYKPWNFKGLTNKNRLERLRFRREVQKIVLERDGYKCQICKKGGNLQVDHIQSWAKFPLLRFDPNNCRTLCQNCHYFVTFGREMPCTLKAWGQNLKRRILQ